MRTLPVGTFETCCILAFSSLGAGWVVLGILEFGSIGLERGEGRVSRVEGSPGFVLDHAKIYSSQNETT